MSFLLNVVDNYVTEVAASMLFGLGYYLVKGMKKKKEGEKSNEDEKKIDDLKMNNTRSKLEDALEKWNYVKTIEEYNSLIKENYGQVEAHEVLRLIVNKGLSPNIDTYNALLLNCFHGKKFETAKNLKEEILDSAGPVVPNTYTFNILIKGLGLEYKQLLKNEENKSKEELHREFDEDLGSLISSLKERNISMDIIAHNTILDCLIDQGRLEDAWEHFTQIKDVKCDYYTYTTLLKGIRHSPQLKDIWFDRSFHLLTEAKFINKVEESFYNSLLDLCVKYDKIEIAERLFNNMLSESNFNLKEYSYSIMIKAYSKRLNLKKALEIFNLLKQRKSCGYKESDEITVDKLSLRSGITGKKLYFQNNSTYFNVKQDNSSYPTTVTYGSILNACIRCNDIYTAELIFHEMDRFSIHKNAFIFSTMINGYRKSHNYIKAVNLYESLLTSMLQYDKNSEFDKISKITLNFNQTCNQTQNTNLNTDEDAENRLNIVIFNTILDCCVECDKFDKMEEVFNFLKILEKEGGLIPNSTGTNLIKILPDIITYSIVMKGYAKANKIDKVMDLYSYMSSNKEFVMDEVLYNTLLDSFARNGDEENLIKIFQDMRRRNIKTSVVTYGVVIKLYANLGDINNANEIFEDLINQGIKPSVIIYQLLLRLYSRQKMPYKAIDIFRNMLLMKVKPDQMIYDYIINICLRNYYLKESVEFVIESIKDGIILEESLYDYLVDYLIQDVQFSENDRILLMNELYNSITQNNFGVNGYILNKMKQFLSPIKNKYNSAQKNSYNNNYYNNNYNHKQSKYDTYTKKDYSFPWYDDNQSCYSSFNIKGGSIYQKDHRQDRHNQEFEYEIDLNSNKEFFYPVKDKIRQPKMNYNSHQYSHHNYHSNRKPYSYSKQNQFKNAEKSIYDL